MITERELTGVPVSALSGSRGAGQLFSPFNSGKTRLPKKKKKDKITNKQNRLNSKRQTDSRRYGGDKIFLRPRGADLETYKQKIE